jgi:tRNA(Ile)-lysidine synthase
MMSGLSQLTPMDKGFREFISREKLFENGEKILLAVSGGIDSVTMLNLFVRISADIGVVHCNFQLRGLDSDEDEIFVRNLCNRLQIPFFSKRFSTLKYAEERKISIQLAARELRYHYFEEVRNREGYNWIAVAHNSDDTIETFFINLIRGTGIQGLTGIKSKSGRIIRPILFASREQIEMFSREIKMVHRVDKSNVSNKYRRNQIRNEVIPLIIDIAPGFRKTILDVMHNLADVSQVYHYHLQNSTEHLINDNGERMEIDIDYLKKLPFYHIFLPEVLRKFGFTADVSRNVINSLESEPGKSFLSSSHRLIKDRSKLLIDRRSSEPGESFYIDAEVHAIETPLALKLSNESIDRNFIIPAESSIACIDADKLVFPLILRHWKTGDYFRPLGMDQMKKLSDFYINEKFSVLDKERSWLLVSDGKIVWICGHRLDDRFKITAFTSRIVKIEILD